jgi:NAD(P)-dependent dehydrogenase (short-subunit alcohol dehydrogenase family)
VANENEPVGDFTGHVVVVTGASSGIGLAAATRFARLGARVALVGRDTRRLDRALCAVRGVARPDAAPEAFQADFAVLAEVHKLAGALASAYPSIAVLCNNAGGMHRSRQFTVDGHELAIQCNHLAPFLLTNLLLDQLAGGRVVNTASTAHQIGALDPDHLNGSGRYRALAVYGSSKQANILFTAEAARRWPRIASFAYHPGVVRSRFGNESALIGTFYRLMPALSTPEQGADTMVWLAGRPLSEVDNGGYYQDRRRRRPARQATDPELAARLWTASEAAVGLA